MNLLAASAAAAAKSQGRFTEYDHISTGNATAVPKKEPPTSQKEMPFDISTIILHPTNLPMKCFGLQRFCCNDSEYDAQEWRLAHVADLSTLHLYTTNEKTRCELWAKMWSTSRILAEILSGNTVCSNLSNLNVLEIGAGTALCGIIVASYGAKVKVTDSSEQALTLAMKSASLNNIQNEFFKTERLNWHSLEAMPKKPSYELLIGSDVLFMEMNIKSIINVIIKNVLPNGLAIILDPGRPCAENFQLECENYHHQTDLDSLSHPKKLVVEKLIIENLIISKNKLLKKAVLYLITVNSDGTKEPIEQIDLLKQNIIDTWTYLSHEHVVESVEDRDKMSYEYTEDLGN